MAVAEPSDVLLCPADMADETGQFILVFLRNSRQNLRAVAGGRHPSRGDRQRPLTLALTGFEQLTSPDSAEHTISMQFR